MKALLYILAALCGYFVAGFNPAITMSRAIYHKDIRECGSGNAGFTNFKRVFGNKWAWWVMILDLFKAALVVGLFAWLFQKYWDAYQFGAAYTGLFAMLGHVYPIQYRFKGGKGFLVLLSTVFVIDWRVGVLATAVMVLLLLITRYMSLSTVVAMLLCPVALAILDAPLTVICLNAVCAIFMAIRHRENFKRLCRGEETKFCITGKKVK